MKEMISMLLVAVMLCVGLSSCGEEADPPVVPETVPLSVTTKVMSRETYEAEHDSIDFTRDQIILNMTIITSEKLRADTLFPVIFRLGLNGVRQDQPYFDDANNARLGIYDFSGQISESFNVYTSELKEFEHEQKSLISYYGDIDLNDEYTITLSEYFEQKTYDFTTVYVQLDCSEEKFGNLAFYFSYCGHMQHIDLYYATDGEYIAYSVKSISAAQAALGK